MDDQSLVPNQGKIATFLHQSVTFSGFHCFHFHCVLFWSFPFKPPLRKSDFLGGIINYLKHITSFLEFTNESFLSEYAEISSKLFFIRYDEKVLCIEVKSGSPAIFPFRISNSNWFPVEIFQRHSATSCPLSIQPQ